MRVGNNRPVQPISQTQPRATEPSRTAVRPGETLEDVARRTGVDSDQLRQANPELAHGAAVKPGQELQLPAHREAAGATPGAEAAPSLQGQIGQEAARAAKPMDEKPKTAEARDYGSTRDHMVELDLRRERVPHSDPANDGRTSGRTKPQLTAEPAETPQSHAAAAPAMASPSDDPKAAAKPATQTSRSEAFGGPQHGVIHRTEETERRADSAGETEPDKAD